MINLLPSLLPPHLPECAALVWHGGGLEQKHVHEGRIVMRSRYTVGSHVCKYDWLFTISSDGGILDDICSPVSGYIRWLPWCAKSRVTPGYVLALVEPDKRHNERLRASEVTTRHTTPPPIDAPAERKLELVLPFRPTGKNKRDKVWIDEGCAEWFRAEHERLLEAGHATTLGNTFTAFVVAWAAMSDMDKRRALRVVEQGREVGAQ